MQMGMYTHLKVECVLKSEFIEVIQRFISNNYTWQKQDYPLINDWLIFLRENNHAIIKTNFLIYKPYKHEAILDDLEIFYDPTPSSGLTSKWGSYCELEENVWKFTSRFKNYNDELEQFHKLVLSKFAEDILEFTHELDTDL